MYPAREVLAAEFAHIRPEKVRRTDLWEALPGELMLHAQ